MRLVLLFFSLIFLFGTLQLKINLIRKNSNTVKLGDKSFSQMIRNDSGVHKNKNKSNSNILSNPNEISSEKTVANNNSMAIGSSRNQTSVNHTLSLSQRGILMEHEKFKSHRYDNNDQGPFVVQIMDSREGFITGNLHIVSIGVKLFYAGFKVTAFRKSGSMRVSLSFCSFQEANNFIDNGINSIDINWRAYIPDDGYYKIGIITGVLPEISEDTIVRGFICTDNEIIDKVERISKFVDSDHGKIKVNSENKNFLQKGSSYMSRIIWSFL